MSAGAAMLQVEDVHTYYGNIRALKGVSLTVNRGEIVTLIGSNGAGKTTTLKTVIGTVHPLRGRITFNGQRIDSMSTDRIVRLGIAQSPEGRRIFPRMTLMENLELGAFARRDRENIRQDIERVLTLFPPLRERLAQKGGTLSGGEQQMLPIRPWGSRRSWSRRSSRSSRTSTSRARPSCSWSRTPGWPSGWPTGAT